MKLNYKNVSWQNVGKNKMEISLFHTGLIMVNFNCTYLRRGTLKQYDLGDLKGTTRVRYLQPRNDLEPILCRKSIINLFFAHFKHSDWLKNLNS